MKSKTKIKGLWWFPEKAKEKWVGTLSSGKSRFLRLKFTVPQGYHKALTDSPEVIHGLNSNAKPITLLFPGRARTRRGAAFTEYEFTAGYAIVGFHLKNANDLRLNKVTLSLPYVHDWMQRTGFSRRQHTGRRFLISYSQPKVLTYKITDNLRLETNTWARTREGGHSYEAEELTEWRLCFRKAVGLRDILDLVTAFRSLIHFSVLRPVYLKRLEGNKNRHGTKYPGLFLPENVEIISDLARPGIESFMLPQEFVFTYADVAKDFEGFLRRWIDYETDFKDALSRYYTTIYHSQTAEEQHLSLTRALDAYYGIKNKMRDLNDFPRKIRELTARQYKHISRWEPIVDVFVEKVKATRHFHTHYNPKWKASGKVQTGAELVKLNTVLRLIFQMCVLEDIGIPSGRFGRLDRQMPSFILEITA